MFIKINDDLLNINQIVDIQFLNNSIFFAIIYMSNNAEFKISFETWQKINPYIKTL